METVELHQAFFWECPNCGVTNLSQGVILEINQEESEELIEDYGMEPEIATTGNWVTLPEEVECSECGKEYETIECGGY